MDVGDDDDDDDDGSMGMGTGRYVKRLGVGGRSRHQPSPQAPVE